MRTQRTPEHPLGTRSIPGAEPQGCRDPDLAPPIRGSPLPGDAVGPRAAAPVAVTAEGPAAPVPGETRGASRAAPRLHLPAGAGRKHGCGFREPCGGRTSRCQRGQLRAGGFMHPLGCTPNSYPPWGDGGGSPGCPCPAPPALCAGADAAPKAEVEAKAAPGGGSNLGTAWAWPNGGKTQPPKEATP